MIEKWAQTIQMQVSRGEINSLNIFRVCAFRLGLFFITRSLDYRIVIVGGSGLKAFALILVDLVLE